MATSLNDTLRNNMLGQISTSLTTTSRLLVYTGAAPSKTAAPTGTLLATFTLSSTPGSASAGTYTVTAPANVTGAASGTPGYYRCIDGTVDNGSHTQIQGSAGVAVAAPSGLAAGAVTGSDGTWGTGNSPAVGTFFYKVTACTAAGETTGSNEATQTVATATNHIPLSWSAVTGAVEYKVYRSASSGGQTNSPALIGITTTTSFNDTGIPAATGAVPPYNSAGGDLAFASTIASGGTVGITSLSYTDGNA